MSILFGIITGISLGLTGGGGAVFAVPMLVYGLGIPTRQAVLISLVSVGATALLGFLQKWRRGEAELRTGLLFAAAGILGAPLGSWTAHQIPDPLLMLLFALL
ncbi:MAG: sulfite exporter TauE/SafE family protein, partial [Planctomyces sp.]